LEEADNIQKLEEEATAGDEGLLKRSDKSKGTETIIDRKSQGPKDLVEDDTDSDGRISAENVNVETKDIKSEDDDTTSSVLKKCLPLMPLRQCVEWVRSKFTSNDDQALQAEEAVSLMEIGEAKETENVTATVQNGELLEEVQPEPSKPDQETPDELLSWSMVDKGDHISYDGLRIQHTGTKGGGKQHSLIRTTKPISSSATSFYFEATVIQPGETGEIGIGLTKSDYPVNGLMPGWYNGTIGYHGDNGGIYHNTERQVAAGETFGSGDTVGCFLNRIYIDEI
jgi:hypothetical protein